MSNDNTEGSVGDKNVKIGKDKTIICHKKEKPRAQNVKCCTL